MNGTRELYWVMVPPEERKRMEKKPRRIRMCGIENCYGAVECAIDRDRELAYIFNLRIEPKHRSQGHGRVLLKLAIEEIRQRFVEMAHIRFAPGHGPEVRIVAAPYDDGPVPAEKLKTWYEREGLIVVPNRWDLDEKYRKDYLTQCQDCRKFVPSSLWIRRDGKDGRGGDKGCAPVCRDCRLGYDPED